METFIIGVCVGMLLSVGIDIGRTMWNEAKKNK
jgi:hypothetical protein